MENPRVFLKGREMLSVAVLPGIGALLPLSSWQCRCAGRVASFASQAERGAALSVNQVGPQIRDAMFIRAVTACHQELGCLVLCRRCHCCCNIQLLEQACGQKASKWNWLGGQISDSQRASGAHVGKGERLLWHEAPSGMQGNQKASLQCTGAFKWQRRASLFKRLVLDSGFRNWEIWFA